MRSCGWHGSFQRVSLEGVPSQSSRDGLVGAWLEHWVSVITYTRQSWSNGKNGDGEIIIPQEIVDYKNKVDL